jgi:hypothetical protein
MPNPNQPNQTPQDQSKKPGMGKPMDDQGQKAQPKTGREDTGDMDKNRSDFDKNKKPGQQH